MSKEFRQRDWDRLVSEARKRGEEPGRFIKQMKSTLPHGLPRWEDWERDPHQVPWE